MNVNELLAAVQSIARNLARPAPHPGTDVVVRCLDQEFPIDAIRLETSDRRPVIVIRIEPEDLGEVPTLTERVED